MSMFDAVRNNKRIVQIFLGLITLPFAFWGVDSYVRNSGAGNDLAKVGDSKISVMEFDKSMREQQDRMRQQMGASFRPEMMNTPEVRLAILNELIDRRLILLEGTKGNITVTDDTLRQVIASDPNLQEGGKFSMARYEQALRRQGMSQPQYEAMLRQDIMLQQVVASVGETSLVSGTQVDALLRIQAEERQVAEFRLTPEQFTDKVKVDATEIRSFYDENIKQFQIPEQIKAEYVVLSLDALLAQASVTDAEVKAWYDSHKDRYQQAEERRASHILIKSEGADKDKARAKAEDILKELRKTPAKFAELARQKSEDPGSAAKGGDLGFFGRGMMVKAFEEVVFSLKEGEISGVVDSEFGFHIIRLSGIKGGKVRSLAEVRGEIESELKKQSASRKFAEAAESFSNMVYEQSDSLAPVAERFKLKTQQTGRISRDTPPQSLGPLGNEKVLTALFSDEAIKEKRNVEAVEVAQNTLISARVIEHIPAAARPFDSVKGQIEALLKSRAVADMAKKAGEEKLADLRKGEDKINWGAAKTVSRALLRQMPPGSLQAIYKADASKLPAYAGVPVAGGYSIYKILKITHPDKIDEAKRKAIRQEYGRMVAQEDFAAYLSGLRSRYKVEINTKLLENKER